jgi:hypothetical protein
LCPLIYSQRRESIGLTGNSNRQHSLINILNDDVLLNVFHLYRLANEYDDKIATVFVWHRQRWWYKLAHVCRQWRNIILQSPSRLDLHLLCTNGVPVADMLAHSPPLPLTIYYHDMFCGKILTAEDESGILLALSHRDRVHRINFLMLPNVGKFFTVKRNQLPILERLHVYSRFEMVLPVTFRAPNLRHLTLWRASLSIGSPVLTTTAAGLVTLDIPAFAYFPPSYLHTRLSLMLQLEELSIDSHTPLPNRDIETQSLQTPSITQKITLPNLRRLVFRGTTTNLEDLVARISAPSLNSLRVYLFHWFGLTNTIPHLLQFMQTSENLTFNAVHVTFNAVAVSLHAVPWNLGSESPLMLVINFGYPDLQNLHWQIVSATQLFGTLSPVLSVVEKVTFSYQEHNRSSEHHNNIDQSQWRELLRPFVNVKTIRIQDDVISNVFHSLPYDDVELLPNLEEVEYSEESDARDTLTTFLNEQQVVDHPVSLRLVDCSTFDKPFRRL